MRKIIRSLLWTTAEEKKEASENYKVARADRLVFMKQAESKVLEYLVDFFVTHGESPSLQVVKDYFEQAAMPEEVTLVDAAAVDQFYSGSSFTQTFEVEVETQAVLKLKFTCQESLKIATTGIVAKGVIYKGVDEAVAYLYSSVEGKPPITDRLPASVKAADVILNKTYQDRKTNPQKTYGVMTGYGLIDGSTAGIRKKSLYVHAGAQGHLKSSFIFNMMVNAATDGGWNPMLFTSEMPADDVMFLLVAIHSANKKFNGVGRPLPAFKLLLGGLSDVEEKFFKEVKDDLLNNPAHGQIRVIDTSEFTTFGSIMQRTIREHAEMEVDMLWIDYLTRLPVDIKYRGMTIVEARNETIADAKRFAMSFNKGVGLAVGSAFQVNRDGWKRGKEAEGKLNHTALAQYNAVEKEADTITYSWFDEEERATCEPKVGIIKSRWGGFITDPVKLFIEPDSRRIFDLSTGMTVSNSMSAPTQSSGAPVDDVEI